MATQTRGRSRPTSTRNQHHATPSTSVADPEPETAAEPAADTGVAHAGHARAAADQATRRNSTQVNLPLVGTVKLPATDELAFLGGVGVLAVVGAIEWPVAVVLAAGHALASSRRNKTVREFGEALEKV
jgi:hypothetical protein